MWESACVSMGGAFEALSQRTENVESHLRSAFTDGRLGDGIVLFEADEWDMCIDCDEPGQVRAKDEREV